MDARRPLCMQALNRHGRGHGAVLDAPIYLNATSGFREWSFSTVSLLDARGRGRQWLWGF
jgi:hypothetical protein